MSGVSHSIGARHEIGDHRIERHAVAGDQDAGLPGGAEGGLQPARPHLPVHGRGRCTSCRSSNRCRPPAAACPRASCRSRSGSPLSARARRAACGPCAFAAAARSGSSRSRLWSPLARSNPCSSAVSELRLPRLRDHAAPVRHADHQRLRAPPPCASASVMSGRPMSALQPAIRIWPSGELRAPVLDALRHLGRQRVGGVAEEQKVGRLDHRGLRRGRIWATMDQLSGDVSAFRGVRGSKSGARFRACDAVSVSRVQRWPRH